MNKVKLVVGRTGELFQVEAEQYYTLLDVLHFVIKILNSSIEIH